jgi:PAS domain S-box-containing protein
MLNAILKFVLQIPLRLLMNQSSLEPLLKESLPGDPYERIAELERTVRELRDKETLLQLVLNTIPGRVFWKDKDLRYLGANQRFAHDAQLEHSDLLIGKDDYQMVWREMADLYRGDDRLVIDNNQSKINFEEPQNTPSGKAWMLVSKIPLRNADGEVIGVLGTYDDITERKMLEQERSDLLERTQRLLTLSRTLTTVSNVDEFIEIMYGITETPAVNLTLLYIDNDAHGEPEYMTIVAGSNADSAVGMGFEIKSLPSASVWIKNTTSATLFSDVLTDESFDEATRRMIVESGTRAMGVVPLYQANRWIGVLSYSWSDAREFTAQEREFFSQLTPLVTPVVANLRAVEQWQKSLNERASLLERTQRLLNLSNLLTTVSDVRTLVDIMYAVTDAPADSMTLQYIDNNEHGEPEILRIVAGNLPDVEYGMEFPLKYMPAAQTWINSPNTATLLSDILTEERFDEGSRRLMLEGGNRAMAVVPLYQAGRWVGTFTYFWHEPHKYSTIEQELFSQLPSLVTPVVANLRSIEQLESSLKDRALLLDRTQRLLNFSRLLTTVNDTNTLIELLQSVTETPSDLVTLLYIDNDDQDQPEFMMPVAGSNPDQEYGIRLPLKYLPSAQLWLGNTSSATLISDILTEEGFDEESRQIILQLGQRSMAVIPLFQANRWVGVVTYLWSEPHEYTHHERELFSQLPSLVTPVVANLRSVEQLESSLEERAALLNRTQRLLTVSQLLTTVVDKKALVDIMYRMTDTPANNLSLLYIDSDEYGAPEVMTIVAGSNEHPSVPYGTTFPMNAHPAVKLWIGNTSTATLISDVMAEEQFDERSRQIMTAAGQRAMAVVPLFQGNRWVGILGYFWNEPREFSTHERELFSQLPSLVTPVVANVRSVEQLASSLKELEVASAMARESNRLKSEFLATMSHELRTPMNAIEGFTSIMLSGMGGTEFNEASRRYLDRINANSKRLLGLINDFLDLSRIESGRLKLVSIAVNPRDLALRWRDQVSVLAQNRGLALNVHIDEAMPETVFGDEENISRIAINLLGNAIKFTEQGSVTMRLYPQEDMWALEVEDTGIGIPPHAREFIFDEFRQVDNSSKRQYGGSGLGLAIVQKLARAMKGNIVLKSEVGEGSTFTVLLPMQLETGSTR